MTKIKTTATSEALMALFLDAQQLPKEMSGTDWNPCETKIKRIAFAAKSMADQHYWLLSGGQQPDWGLCAVAAKSAAFISRRAERIEDGMDADDELDDSRQISHHDDMMANAFEEEFDALVKVYELASDEAYINPTYTRKAVSIKNVSPETLKRASRFAA